MEILIKKASVDPDFSQKLLSRRAKVAEELGLPLDASEKLMLETIPEAQLSAIIRQTRVPQQQKPVFLGTSAAAMLALLAQFTFSPVAGRAEEPTQPTEVDQPLDHQTGKGGVRPDLPRQQLQPPGNDDYYGREGGARPDFPSEGIRPDFPMPPGGARPDVPIAPIPVPLSDNKQLQRIVQEDQQGRMFLEAVDNLKKELGLKISVEVPSGMNVSWTVDEHTNGLTLEETLAKMVAPANAKGYSLQIIPLSGQITLRFQQGSAPDTEVTPPATQGIRPDYPSETRGIRPDYPEGTKGIRPDFPSNQQNRTPSDDDSNPASTKLGGIRPDFNKLR